jgi:hypothetical protein
VCGHTYLLCSDYLHRLHRCYKPFFKRQTLQQRFDAHETAAKVIKEMKLSNEWITASDNDKRRCLSIMNHFDEPWYTIGTRHVLLCWGFIADNDMNDDMHIIGINGHLLQLTMIHPFIRPMSFNARGPSHY